MTDGVLWGDCVGGVVSICCDGGAETEDCVLYGPNGLPLCNEHGVPINGQVCEDIQDDDQSECECIGFLALYIFFVSIIVFLVYWLISEAAK